ncbi:MAG: hypothetical protein V4611_02370 [Patescibacteria group bacterium]
MSERNFGEGALITFEGGDGSGKGTQTELYYQYLLSLDLPVKKGGFPMYKTPTGEKIGKYLNGDYGEDLTAEEAGLLYQEDRVANIGPIQEWVEQGGIYLLDRYFDSNNGHQGGKLRTKEERIAYILKNTHTETVVNGLPVPDLTVLFTLAPELAYKYVAMKTAASREAYTTLTHDIHENNRHHLADANEAFLLLPELYPERFRHINTTAENGLEMLPKDKIQLAVQSAVRPLLLAKGYRLAA